MSSAEPISRTSASATSITTSTDRVLFWRNPLPGSAAAFLERRRQIGLRALKRRDQAEEDARAERHDQRERHHPPVDSDERTVFADARKAGGVDRQERADSDHPEQQSEHAADRGQDDALRQQLSNDAAA